MSLSSLEAFFLFQEKGQLCNSFFFLSFSFFKLKSPTSKGMYNEIKMKIYTAAFSRTLKHVIVI